MVGELLKLELSEIFEPVLHRVREPTVWWKLTFK
jgi:hypothetical protein